MGGLGQAAGGLVQGTLGTLTGNGKNMPAPPDYTGLATQQAGLQNQLLGQQTLANRPDILTPFQQQQWTQGPDGSWSMNQSLSPEQQALLNQQQGIGQSANEAAMGLLGQGIGGQASEDALYGRLTSRLDPQWNQRADSYQTQLYNQGLRPGDSAYDTAMQNFDRGRNDAYSQAGYQAVLGGDQSALSQASLINLLRGMGTIDPRALQTPGFAQAGQGAAPDLLGAGNMDFQAQLAQHNAQQAGVQNLLNAGLTLAPLLMAGPAGGALTGGAAAGGAQAGNLAGGLMGGLF